MYTRETTGFKSVEGLHLLCLFILEFLLGFLPSVIQRRVATRHPLPGMQHADYRLVPMPCSIIQWRRPVSVHDVDVDVYAGRLEQVVANLHGRRSGRMVSALQRLGGCGAKKGIRDIDAPGKRRGRTIMLSLLAARCNALLWS